MDYEKAAEELDIRGLELDEQLQDVDKEIEFERENLTRSSYNEKLNRRASIGLFTDSEGEVEIALKYGGFSDIQATYIFSTDIYLSSCTLGILECWIRHTR